MPDTTCLGGYRYDPSAGDDLAGTCVSPNSDAHLADARPADVGGLDLASKVSDHGPSPDTIGSPIVLAGGLAYPVKIVADSSDLYWMEVGTGIMKMPLGGGVSPTLISADSDASGWIAFDGASFYWTDFCSGKILSVPASGGGATLLATGSNPLGIAVDSSSVYWADNHSGSILKVPLGGGTPSALANGLSAPEDVAINATDIFWTEAGGGVVARNHLAGLPGKITLASGLTGPHSLTLDAVNIYWTDAGDGKVESVPLGGGTTVVIASSLGRPHGIAVGNGFVYWTNAGGATVMKAPVGGGAPIVLGSAQNEPEGILLKSGFVYWTDGGSTGIDGSVNRNAW